MSQSTYSGPYPSGYPLLTTAEAAALYASAATVTAETARAQAVENPLVADNTTNKASWVTGSAPAQVNISAGTVVVKTRTVGKTLDLRMSITAGTATASTTTTSIALPAGVTVAGTGGQATFYQPISSTVAATAKGGDTVITLTTLALAQLTAGNSVVGTLNAVIEIQ